MEQNKLLLFVMFAIVASMVLIPTADASQHKKDICHQGKTLNIGVNSSGHNNHSSDTLNAACTQQQIDDYNEEYDKKTKEQKDAQKAADKAQKKADKAQDKADDAKDKGKSNADDLQDEADDLQDEADKLQDKADNTSGSTTTQKDKKGSDHADLQRYLERPSFGMNYKIFQPFEEAGVTINGFFFQMVDNIWRIFAPDALLLNNIYTMEVTIQSEHGIREVTVTPNKTCERCHNNPERFTILIRDGGQYGDHTFVWKTIGTNANITAERDGEYVTLYISGLFNQSGILQLEARDNNNESQMLFVHLE